MIEIKIDHNQSMIEVVQKGSTLFYGNFWDFTCYDALPELIRSLGFVVKVDGDWDCEDD